MDPCALIQAQYLKQMFDNLSSTAGQAYQNCASNYDDILHKWLSGAVEDLRHEIYNDAKNQVQTALKYHFECFDQLKNVKYPYNLGISLKNFCAFLIDAGGVIDQIGRSLNCVIPFIRLYMNKGSNVEGNVQSVILVMYLINKNCVL